MVEPATSLPRIHAIALDGGTTNTRARLLKDGRIVATARRAVGVRDAARGGSAQANPLADAVRVTIEEVTADDGGRRPDLIVAAGMLSSELGLLTVPHVAAPAGLAELARGMAVRTLPEVTSTPIGFVPGVRTPAGEGPLGWTRADVMRGEECETIGALGELARDGTLDPDQDRLVFLWPGSHTKLVALDRKGRIVGSQTSLAGELIQAVAQQTLIAASLPPELPHVLDAEAAAAGATAAGEQGLARAAFLVRIAALENRLGAAERAAFWIGAVVGDDARALARHRILSEASWVGVGGREPLRSLYAQALAGQISAPVARLDDALCERASALGALAVALSARERR